MLALALPCCVCGAGVAVFGVQDSTDATLQLLLVVGCIVAAMLVLGIIFMVAGRPRRAQ